MARIRDEIQIIENAAAGRRCIVKVPVGRTILDVHVEHGGLTLAQMKNIKVLLVSPSRTVTKEEYKDGVELNEFNKRLRRETEAGTLSFYFRRPELESEAARMSGALGTGGLMSVRIEFDIAEATTPNIKAWHRKTKNRHVSASVLSFITGVNKGGYAEGENHFDMIDKRDRIAAIHVLNDSIEHLLLRVDDATAFNLSRARCEMEERLGKRTPYASSYGMVIDFMLAGVLDESLIMQDKKRNYQAQEMRLTSTLGTGADSNIRYLVEYHVSWRSLSGTNTTAA